MNREPLRLGTSTSAFFSCLPNDMGKLFYQKEEFTQDESDDIRRVGSALVEAFAESEVQSLEYFLACAMLPLGTKHPLAVPFMKLAEEGMLWSVHAPFDGVDIASLDEEKRRWSVWQVIMAADIATEMNAKVVTIHGGLEGPDLGPKEQRIRASAFSLSEIAEHCNKIGVRPAIELLPRNCIGNTPDELLAILHYSGSANAGICLDCNHFFPANDLPDAVRRLGTRIITLHTSDHDDTDEKHWFPMKGVIDWPGYISALREIKYGGPLMYEISSVNNSTEDTVNALQENYAALMQGAN